MKPRPPLHRIHERVQPAGKKIKRQSPVCQIGEIGEALAGAAGGGVGVVPAEDGEDGGESVEGEEEACEGEEEGREDPGCCVAGGWIEGRRGAEEEVVNGDHIGGSSWTRWDGMAD